MKKSILYFIFGIIIVGLCVFATVKIFEASTPKATEPPPESTTPEIQLSSSSLSIQLYGEPTKIQYSTNNLGTYSVSCTVEDESVLTVDQNYYIHPLKTGETTVTISINCSPTVYTTMTITIIDEQQYYYLVEFDQFANRDATATITSNTSITLSGASNSWAIFTCLPYTSPNELFAAPNFEFVSLSDDSVCYIQNEFLNGSISVQLIITGSTTLKLKNINDNSEIDILINVNIV